jgi:hypothetical protein
VAAVLENTKVLNSSALKRWLVDFVNDAHRAELDECTATVDDDDGNGNDVDMCADGGGGGHSAALPPVATTIDRLQAFATFCQTTTQLLHALVLASILQDAEAAFAHKEAERTYGKARSTGAGELWAALAVRIRKALFAGAMLGNLGRISVARVNTQE